MIKTIKIKNIQSHKETILELSPGINAIVGSSNNGKSAILRALYWVRYNRPLGTDTLLSHWAVDKKGNQIEPMLAEIENENGTIIRRRTKDENQYIVNGEELNVVKTDVPEQVERALKLSDTNIQKQQDAPFLLSLSSGAVAQYFNKTVRLDIIDRILSNAENKRRKTNQEIGQVEELCESYIQKKEKYSWLDEVEKLLTKYENISEKNEGVKNEYDKLSQQIELYKKYSLIEQKYKFISEAKKIIEKIESLGSNIQIKTEELAELNNSLINMKNCKVYPAFEEEKNLIEKIEKLNVREIKNNLNYLSMKINSYREMDYKIKGCKSNIEGLKKQLPNICPLCGNIMNNGVCENEN